MPEAALDSLALGSLLLVIASGFIATNLDNLLILVGLLGSERSRAAAITAGYLAAVSAVLAVALLGAALGTLIDPRWAGYLGVIPLLLGLSLLIRLLRETTSGERATPRRASELGIGLASFSLMVSNSGDSIAVFLPLFAESGREALLIEIAAYLFIAITWGGLAHLLVGHERIARLLGRYGRWVVPFIMIAVGSYILLDTRTDTLY